MDQLPPRSPPAEALPHILDRAAFRRWMEGRPGRYERVEGEVVRMNAERVGHARVKMRVWQVLDRAIRDAGLDCEALGDGITVEIGEGTDYEPDALVECDPRLPDQVVAAIHPTIVVEVASPGTPSVDAGVKLIGYFRVPSIEHYLLVGGNRRTVIHHRRLAADRTEARILTAGPLHLDPPGLTVTVEDFFVDLRD